MVIFQESFLNPTDGRIYTSFLVEVDKVFKGSIIGDKIEIITLGGRVGNRAGIVSDAPKFNLGQRGIFFARTMDQLRSVNQTPNPSFKLTYKIGGFIALLDGKDNSKAVDVFSTYQSIRTCLEI